MDSLTKQGISALKQGNKNVAQNLLQQAVQNNPHDLEAWLWLSGAVSTNQERIHCLQKVLEIDPNNQVAAKGIAKLVSEGRVSLNSVDGGNEISRRLPSSQDIVPLETQHEETKSSTSYSREKKIFSVKPSLTPTLISRGIVLLILILITVRFLSPAFSLIAEYDSGSLLPLTCVSLFLLPILSYPLLKKVLNLLYTTYTLTTKKIIIESGIIGRSHKTIPIRKIQDVGYKQSILERFFGIGDVIVESAGEQGAIHLLDLPNCQQRTQQILKLVEKMALR